MNKEMSKIQEKLLKEKIMEKHTFDEVVNLIKEYYNA